jgi:hypothetical protein
MAGRRVTADYNGWADLPENEREYLELYDRPCGGLLQSAHEHVAQSRVRIARTTRKWKATTA